MDSSAGEIISMVFVFCITDFSCLDRLYSGGFLAEHDPFAWFPRLFNFSSTAGVTDDAIADGKVDADDDVVVAAVGGNE